MGLALSLVVNAAAALVAVGVITAIIRRRPNVDGRAYATIFLFVAFWALYLVTAALLKLDQTEVCR